MTTSFSYSTLPTDQATRLQEIAETVKQDMFGGIELTLHMGDVLIEAKEMIGHGKFMKWFEAEFRNQWEVSLDTAERWMGLAQNRALVELPFSLTVKYELIGASESVVKRLLAQNEVKRVTVEEARKAVASQKYRDEIESYVGAIEGAEPCEQKKIEETAMAVLSYLQQGFENQKLREEAKVLYEEYGPQLNEWAKVTDNDMILTNNLNAPISGNGNGNAVWTSLEELYNGDQNVVVHVPIDIPNVDKKYLHFVIATLQDVPLGDSRSVTAMNMQCAFLAAGAKAIGLSLYHLG